MNKTFQGYNSEIKIYSFLHFFWINIPLITLAGLGKLAYFGSEYYLLQ